MDTALALVGVVSVLVFFVVIARFVRSRMRTGRFHGIESAVGGSAFMGATRKPGITPPDHGNPRPGTGRPEAAPAQVSPME
ncbi:hypothetical protein CH294_21380 [Rhodococcus sp. 14-2483-1-1]|uniref:hypothetical protein n=1 Tax=Rhodococcus sp. 14-2483-1-1 TaxID=2023148 RepID=UPI000B9C0706|nr:hypothetical protein [Rhodococcus sp. 14-2483-1-1]OZF30848.1 hypothetical protein CH294_21380 [Rhodococcus sp. 14-2483-1-1]